MATFRLTRIHIRLCVIRSWKKNVGNAATKVRKMRAIQIGRALSSPEYQCNYTYGVLCYLDYNCGMYISMMMTVVEFQCVMVKKKLFQEDEVCIQPQKLTLNSF